MCTKSRQFERKCSNVTKATKRTLGILFIIIYIYFLFSLVDLHAEETVIL